MIDPKPKRTIHQEGYDKPNEQGQWNQDGQNHVFEFITKVHKDFHDITRFEKC
jgi:hypothetical protein